jgi:hypothetical protein
MKKIFRIIQKWFKNQGTIFRAEDKYIWAYGLYLDTTHTYDTHYDRKFMNKIRYNHLCRLDRIQKNLPVWKDHGLPKYINEWDLAKKHV